MVVMNQRWRNGRDRYRPVGEVIRTCEYEVAAIDDGPAKAFVLAHHYSGTWPSARGCYGLFRRSRLVGAAVFSHPVQDSVLTNVFATGCAMDSVELGRFVLVDEVPGNGETWFLARCFELLRRKSLVGVVSFSDPLPRRTAAGTVVMPGHVGTIYQAFNGAYLGRATPRTLKLLPDGRVLSARAISKIRAGVKGWAYAVESLTRLGVNPPVCLGGAPDVEELRAWLSAALQRVTRNVRHQGNHKYAWALRRQAERFIETRLPYPKLRDAA